MKHLYIDLNRCYNLALFLTSLKGSLEMTRWILNLDCAVEYPITSDILKNICERGWKDLLVQLIISGINKEDIIKVCKEDELKEWIKNINPITRVKRSK